ncbi:hypothetical protein HCN44_004719 [Aphidius gifuensis]|uniref:Ionotropic receptor n=1 Tax=Aphidius gifuensis TaxID=684658 RepID=A0A834XZR5_APHGI|nr:hypothetical protein HCN44_004719 [Aphidius gifuensis]
MAIILGVAWNKQPVAFSYRIMFMSWVIFGFLLTQFYLASLPGMLLADPEEEINTINDLLDSGIPIGGTKNQKYFFLGNKTFNSSSTSNELIDKIFQSITLFERDEYEKKLYHLISGENTTMALLAFMNFSSDNSNFDSRILRVLPEALTNFALSFAVRRGLPYLNDINIVIQRLMNTGITSHVFSMAEKYHFIENIEDSAYINLKDLIPGLVSPLEPSVWVAIIIVLLFAIIIRYTLFYKISFLEIFAIIIGVAWNRQPMGYYYRTMFISWIIFGFIITQFYLASLPGRLLADPEEDINTISDLIDSKIPIGGTKNVKKYFIGNKTFNDNSTSHQLLHKVFENFIAFERDEYERKLYELISGQNNTIALLASTNTSTINTVLDPRNVRVLPEALTSFPLSFAVWHGLPYLSDIDDCLQRLIKCGVIAHYGHIESNTYPNDEIDEIYIKLTDLLPGFFVLGIGCAISSIVLYFEIIIFRSKRNHK